MDNIEESTEEIKETANIVVLCDGTWSRPHIKTNVFKLYELLKIYKHNGKELNGRIQKGEVPREALVYDDYYYEAGVGGKYNVIEASIASEIDRKIKNAYTHIVKRYNYYHHKDNEIEIWLFGFSRGAYTVRCVAGMIRNCGILKYNSKELIDRAYELYRSRDLNHNPNGQESKKFRNSFSHPLDFNKPIIRFLGLWDTVGAHGLPSLSFGKGLEYLKLHDLNTSNLVKNAYQILSIHERASLFEPCRIFRKDCKRCVKGKECACTKLVTEEIWFPGAHLEVGGGIYSVDNNISVESFRWMIGKIIHTGGLLPKEKEKLEENLGKISKPSWIEQKIISFIAFNIKQGFSSLSSMGRDRIIPLFKDREGKLTFKLLYKEGKWESERFKNIEMMKEIESSLSKFCNTMIIILAKELNINVKDLDQETIEKRKGPTESFSASTISTIGVIINEKNSEDHIEVQQLQQLILTG